MLIIFKFDECYSVLREEDAISLDVLELKGFNYLLKVSLIEFRNLESSEEH